MLVAPAFLDALTVQQAVFVIAHELYHVLYGVFDRFDSDTPPDRRWLVNVAHDFIINDMLERKFAEAEFSSAGGACTSRSKYIPREGLFWANYARSYKRIVGRDQPPLKTFTLESLVLELERIRSELPTGNPFSRMVAAKRQKRPWGARLGDVWDKLDGVGGEGSGNTESEVPPHADDGASGEGGDRDFSNILNRRPELLSEREESELFPNESELERLSKRERIREAKELSSTREAACRGMDVARGRAPGDGDAVVHAMGGTWDVPWERALQKWLDDTEPPIRSWAKASRRAGDRTDVVLPGRQNEGRLLNIVVDTSGSMVDDLPAAFGMIQFFCKGSGVHAVRIVQCDAEVTGDDLVDIDDLASFEVKGFGGSDMSPGLLRLADDPTVEAAVVLTDGCIDYPQKGAIPFEVLWCIIGVDGGVPSWFNPGYGSVVGIPLEPIQSYRREIP
jgi:predicted metal-dependent peptidase